MILVQLLCLWLSALCAHNVNIEYTDNQNIPSHSSQNLQYKAAEPINIRIAGFSLSTDSGSLKHNLSVNVMVIPYEEGYTMPSNLSNVSLLSDGVRLLPNGIHFADTAPASISLAYDPTRIPIGYQQTDIYTYYCDDAQGWHRLERISIDTIAHIVTSITTHFTDFANAVIKIPDMPESKAYVPTAMTDIPDIDPMFGIPMIDIPTVNNKGTVELTYPIVLPKGRHGMQPNVDLHYSNIGSNGVLGVGWGFPTPSITIDTRWGVPRFDPLYESEQYVVNGATVMLRQTNGAALSLPHQDHSYQPRSGTKVRFYARDNKNQDRVLRFGSNPTNYWWAVTDRNGITTFYGRTFCPNHSDDRSIDEQSVVRASNGCIVYWAATASIDVYGNYILYTNERVDNTIYIRQIDYTGNTLQNILPVYRVRFNYMNRIDITSSARLGVLQREERRLCNLLIQYHTPEAKEPHYTDNLAAYYMQYTEPQETNLYKTRLEKIVMLDSVHDLILDELCSLEMILMGNVERNDLSKEWLQEAEQNGNKLLYENLYTALTEPYGTQSVPANVTTFTYADAPLSSELFGAEKVLSTPSEQSVSGSHSSSWSIGGTATVGIGPDVATTILSAGGNYDYSRSKGECTSMLLDLNGDGLTDLVYERDGSVYYRRQYKSGSIYAFAQEQKIKGLTRLSREVTNTHTWGVQLSLGANLSYTRPASTTYTDTYFADVNADGLPDMVDGDCILINRLENGVPTFDRFMGIDSQTIDVHNSRCGSIILDGEVNEHIECEVKEVLVNRIPLDKFYSAASQDDDVVIERVDDNAEAYPEMLYSDKNVIHFPEQTNVSDEIDQATSNLPDLPKFTYYRKSHQAGILQDSLIYRIEDGHVCVYQLEYVCNPIATDPEIETVRIWVAPRSGILHITDSISLLKDTSASRSASRTADGVVYTIQHCLSVIEHTADRHLHANGYHLLQKDTLSADDYSVHTWNKSISVQKGDILMFRLRSGGNNRFDRTAWHHIIRYADEAQAYDSYNDYLCTGKGYFQANYNGKAVLTLSGNNDDATPIALRVKHLHNQAEFYLLDTTLRKGKIHIAPIEIPVVAEDSIMICLSPLPGNNTEPRWSDIHIFPELQYISDFPTGTTEAFVYDTIVYYPDIQIKHSTLYPPSSLYRQLFGPLYRGWGAFAYQNLHNRDTILLDSLVNTQQLAAELAQQNPNMENNRAAQSFSPEGDWQSQVEAAFDESNLFNPTSDTNYWIPLSANSRTEQWVAYGNMGCIGRLIHSNAREITIQDNGENIIEYDSSLPFVQGETRTNNFVRKQSRSVQQSVSWGVLGIVNQSASSGTYEVVVDYMDMNGDGFPDFVGKGGIQYSMPWGGIGRLQSVNNFSSFLSNNSAAGTSFSACPAQMVKLAGNNIRNNKFCMNASLGGSGSSGETSTQISYVDVNADGLPDKVDAAKQTVRYNLGYAFSEAYPFAGSVNGGCSQSESLNTSTPPFSIGQVSISGGVGGSCSTDETKTMLIDINGDGLPDKIRVNNNQVQVAYNRGTGISGTTFDTWKSLPKGVASAGCSKTNSYTTTLGVTGGFTILGIVKFNIGVQSSPYGESFSNTKIMLTDVDGDGLADYVWQDSGGKVHVRYNMAGRANLLTSVTNPTGQQILLDYSLSQPSVTHKNRQWELRQIIDIAPDHPMPAQRHSITDIEYHNACYDPFEKTDYGYEYIRISSNDEKIRDEFYNQSFLQNGDLREYQISDAAGKMYLRYVHSSVYTDLTSGDKPHNGKDICDDANVYVSQEGYRTEYYEGDEYPQIITHYNVMYDRYHNIVKYIDKGDIAIPDDDWYKEITYLHTKANNMISLPKEESTYSGNQDLLRQAYVNYSQLGEPAHIHLVDKLSGAEAVTHLRYDSFGNVEAVILPENRTGEHNWSAFTYDPVTYSYVVSIDNPFRVRTHTDYDYRWGLPIKNIDPAGNEIRYTYDYKGRLHTVLSPIELSQEKAYTIQYEYNLTYNNLKTRPNYRYSYVAKDMYDSLFVQREVVLYDERGQIMQKKHYTEVEGKDMWVVDGAEEWDVFGRVIAHTFPFRSQKDREEYEFINYTLPFVRTDYDHLDRPLIQTNADSTSRKLQYHFASDWRGFLRFLTVATDENGITTAIFKSPQNWVIQQVAGDGGSTLFDYSPIGELLCTTDADGYKTTYTYDLYGHTISRTHPDAGTTTWEYDLAGNIISQQTANLNLFKEKIQYIYTFNRLSAIEYPFHKENNVRYLYDLAGRIALREDGTGSEAFIYDPLGNVAQSTRRIVIPTENQAYIFRTRYKYDSFGRMRNIIYPDGEVLHYGYTTGGLLKNVVGIKQKRQNIYLWDRVYDEQGRKIYQKFGNGVWTQYVYAPQRQWLEYLHTELPNGEVIQDIHYNYDAIGNVLDINQSAKTVSNGLGGMYDNHYLYDKQYRLITSNGDGDFAYRFNADYSPTGRMGNKYTAARQWNSDVLFGYDINHLTHQPRTIFDPSIGTVDCYWDANGNLSQVLHCKQDAERLHEWDEENRLRFVLGEKYAGYYAYDANGERIYKLIGTSSIARSDASMAKAQVVFDYATLYPNPYMLVTPRGYTKHYYAGTERLATVVGGGGLGDMIQPIDPLGSQHDADIMEAFYRNYQTEDPFYHIETLSKPEKTENIYGKALSELEYQCEPVIVKTLDVLSKTDILFKAVSNNEVVLNKYEDETYFYHGDHLGSTNWITEWHAEPVQYIHYAPFGELIDNQCYRYDAQFKFTGKERDGETGYDYFGARFFWATFTHWLSVDPMADKYPNISPYAYCSWNPIKYVDPNGKWFETLWDAANVALDISSLQSNISQGNIADALLDGVGLLLDAAAAVLPAVPGGAGTALKTYRAADKVKDATSSGKTIITATQNTYRKALQQATGKVGKGYEAHHTLPQKYRKEFEKLGINIDEPGNVVWRKSEGHRKKSAEHTAEWDKFFKENLEPTKEQVMEFRTKTEQKVWHDAPAGDIPAE